MRRMENQSEGIMKPTIKRAIRFAQVSVLLSALPLSAHALQYTAVPLGTLGGTGSYAIGINDSGQVVGYAHTTGNTARHAFISAPNPTGTGQLTDLGTLGGQYSWAYGINDSGQVVGRANTTGDAARHAFLYDAGIMMDLNDLLMVGLDGGAFLREATAINDSGQIVALGSDDFGYLLTPVAASVPEPSTAWLMVSALVGLGAASRRRV